jgi:hypothetical protein
MAGTPGIITDRAIIQKPTTITGTVT